MLLNPMKAVSWLVANKAEIASAVISVVGLISIFLAGLRGVVAKLVTRWPNLAPIDGKLNWLIGVLNGIAQLSVLNWLAANPKPDSMSVKIARLKTPRDSIARLSVVLAVLCVAVAPLPARAADISSGPTIPLLQVRLASPAGGTAVPTVLQAGAGYQVSAGWLPTSVLGKQFDLVQLSLAAFASGGGGVGQASVAADVCTLNQLLCVGFGSDLVAIGGSQTTGLLVHETKANLFALLSLGFEFGFGPYSPPTGIAQGAQGLPRGNHLYWGW